MMQTNDYFELVESELFEILDQEDINFLQEFQHNGQSLIEPHSSGKFRINFVGEVITPNNIYFSMPKNMELTDENVILIKKVLVKYSNDTEGKTLVVSRKGNYSSERAYFNKLKEYFLDYITYEFIYPLKRKKVHSNNPISGGKISVMDTVRNRRRYGSGITYKTKDIENSDDWMLDDIYYYTIKELEDRLKVSQFERNEIKNMTEYLKEEGFNFNTILDGKVYSKQSNKELLDLSNSSDVVKAIMKSEVGVIHNPIKNTLIEYYQYKQKAASFRSVDVIFTKNFERVWELILQDALMDDKSKDFRDEQKSNFKEREITEVFIPSRDVEVLLNQYPLLSDESEKVKEKKWVEKRGGRYFLCERGRVLIPDIFVELKDGKRFIGDAKYYKDPSDSNFDKEFYIYNDAQKNKYPMVIFAIPETENTDRTTVPRRGYRRAPITGGTRELILITVCVKDVINDAISNKSRKVLEDSIYLIKKYTRKSDWLEES